MDFRKKFLVDSHVKFKLSNIDPAYKGAHESHESAVPELARHSASLAHLHTQASYPAPTLLPASCLGFVLTDLYYRDTYCEEQHRLVSLRFSMKTTKVDNQFLLPKV